MLNNAHFFSFFKRSLVFFFNQKLASNLGVSRQPTLPLWPLSPKNKGRGSDGRKSIFLEKPKWVKIIWSFVRNWGAQVRWGYLTWYALITLEKNCPSNIFFQKYKYNILFCMIDFNSDYNTQSLTIFTRTKEVICNFLLSRIFLKCITF